MAAELSVSGFLSLPVRSEVISDQLADVCGASSREVFLGVTMSLKFLDVSRYLAHNCSSKQEAIDPYIFIKKPSSYLRANVASTDSAHSVINSRPRPTKTERNEMCS